MRRAVRRIGVGLVAVAVTLIGLPTAAYAITEPYEILHQRYSGKCMDVRGDSDSVGTYVQQYDCNNTRAQQWKIDNVPGSSDLFTFTAGNGLCLEDRSSFMFSGAPVDVVQCNPSAPQMQWRILGPYGSDNNNRNYWQIQNVQNPRCLDNEFNTDNWRLLLLKDCGTPTSGGGGWWNQQWFVEVVWNLG